jgi:hypothetical protein
MLTGWPQEDLLDALSGTPVEGGFLFDRLEDGLTALGSGYGLARQVGSGPASFLAATWQHCHAPGGCMQSSSPTHMPTQPSSSPPPPPPVLSGGEPPQGPGKLHAHPPLQARPQPAAHHCGLRPVR